MKLKTKKCLTCGKENVEGTKKYLFCQTELEKRKSCPRCAKWNPFDSKMCSHCGYSFVKKNKNLLKNLFFSILLVGILFLFVFLHKLQFVFGIQLVLKIGAFLLFIGIVISIFTYGEKEKVSYSAEEKIVKKNLSSFKKFSFLVLGIGIVIFICIILYFLLEEFF